MKITINRSNPLLGGLIAVEYLKASSKSVSIKFKWSTENTFTDTETIKLESNNDFLRLIARLFPTAGLYGQTPLEKTKIDSWLTQALRLQEQPDNFQQVLLFLNQELGPITYLVANRLTIADLAVFTALFSSNAWQALKTDKAAPVNVLRWYAFIESHTAVIATVSSLPSEAVSALTPQAKAKAASRAQEGKFVELPGAEMGKVVVRFPPEASGFLHIGHAKAALLNQHYQEAFKGKLVMRFDDTNPAKEDLHFEKVILEDVEMLEIKPDMFTHTSQYFDLMLDYCERLLKAEKAYVDDTDAETMRLQREQRVAAPNRANTYAQNLPLWREMLAGSERGQRCCVRAKIDMQSPNGCLRDPTIYRCKNEPHPRTGDKYKVYPTYDFACPIVDAIEGVTHTLRTMEYHDRDPQFYWFIEALGLRRPYIWEYSRLSMTNTVLSKRKLTWFVNEGLVDGWDDPRMPTVRGVLRRGMTVQGLKEFIIAQGSSRSVVFMEWDKIWSFNKKVIDPIAPRFTAIEHKDPVPVIVNGAKEERLSVPKHPKNSEIGNKSVWVGSKLLIERVDAESLKAGENATFINWGNLLIKKINKEKGVIVSVEADLNLDNKDYKKTLKLTWLAVTEKAAFTPTYCVYFDHIISKALLAKDEDFKQFIGHETRKEIRMLGDPELKSLKKGDIIQLQRKGFFKVDVAYQPISLHTCKEQPVVLFYIPDGHSKESVSVPTTAAKTAAPASKKKSKSPRADVAQTSSAKSPQSINEEIQKQGELVRNLKSSKAQKDQIDLAVKTLLQLKLDYKSVTNADWKPGCVPPAPITAQPNDVSAKTPTLINDEIIKQGDSVRNLKSQKAGKNQIDAAVKSLLALKVEYKKISGADWKPGCIVSTPSAAPSSGGDLNESIVAQGNKVRQVKAEKKEKSVVDGEVKLLLNLKQEYKSKFGKDWTPVVEAAKSVKNASQLSTEITKQGELVRNLKALKAGKDHIETAVNLLLALKEEYKKISGVDWKSACSVSTSSVPPSSGGDLNEAIVAQGNKVRQVKAEKKEKSVVDAEVKLLLSLKQEYKSKFGKDWTLAVEAPKSVKNESQLLDEIAKQGDLVRVAKSAKASKSEIDTLVKTLLQVKEEYKKVSGKDWKPDMKPALAASGDSSQKDALTGKINEQGNLVRDLKTKKADKGEIDGAVKQLLDLKSEYKTLTGTDFPVANRPAPKPKDQPAKSPKERQPKPAKQQKSAPQPKIADAPDAGPKKQTRLGLEAKKEENLAEWYAQVITKAEMIEYYDVSGCYILRPWSFAIWEAIKEWLDAEIKQLGVENCYFPIFVSQSVLEKEKDHIADFAPEVAWVTRSGDSEMAEPIAVRPTSETVMYPAYAKWIQSYRDLPIKLNQWNNVVRWEFKHPQPFLRTREFLWQEGHTAHALKSDAIAEMHHILDLYAQIYTDLLAIPVVKGRKTEKEKFAGGETTLTVEAYVGASGRAIQGATSHYLGENFARMFDITYEDPDTQEKRFVCQNSWGVTTRTIGVMIMVHADNRGLVLPPRVACVQVVIVPCGVTVNLPETERVALQSACDALERDLRAAGIKVRGDYRSNYSPGWKFNHWELKGVPVRVELGPKDIARAQLVAVRRDTGAKATVTRATAAAELGRLLTEIQAALLARATEELAARTVRVREWAEFAPNLEQKRLILAAFCGDGACEERIKAETARDDGEGNEPGAPSMGAKSLCIPLEQPEAIKEGDRCIRPACKRKPEFYTLFGRSY